MRSQPAWSEAKTGLARRQDARSRIWLHAGEESDVDQFLAGEGGGHMYARECCANTWYAIGALRLRQGRRDEAALAFMHALDRVAHHPLALAALARDPIPTADPQAAALANAVRHALDGSHQAAARTIGEALAGAEEGNALWLLPVEPLLHVSAHPELWAEPLVRLRSRAACSRNCRRDRTARRVPTGLSIRPISRTC